MLSCFLNDASIYHVLNYFLWVLFRCMTEATEEHKIHFMLPR
uniref:Uncharacterized protein n=1 Tax=Arundo donax TaxID=35708 RepID=A0A0A9CIB3_ARUDO